jgi:hypothetical protein
MKVILAFALVVFACCVMQSQAQPNAPLCVRYAELLNITQTQLVTTVVVATFTNCTTAGAPTKQDFDGSLTNTTDFITNTTAQGLLVTGLVGFFGVGLGCNTTAPYTGPGNMALVHQYLIINNATFEYFNSVVLGVMGGAGVNSTDLAAVSGVLESFRSTICNQPDCQAPITSNSLTTNMLTTAQLTTSPLTTAAKAGSATGVVVSSIALFVAGLIALF